MPETWYIWDELSDNVRMEVDETGSVTAEYMNKPDQFGTLLSQRRNGVNSFYHFDAQGSTRQLTNDAEAVTNTYSYTAFGEPVSSSGTTTNPFRYYGAVGYYSDAETGEIHIRRRVFSPIIARWLTLDPVVFVDGPNNYSYVGNCPTFYYDPEGMLKCIERVFKEDPCAGYQWEITWKPESSERNGIIIQKVCISGLAFNCGDNSEFLPPSVKPEEGANTVVCQASECYFEIWLVDKNGGVFIDANMTKQGANDLFSMPRFADTYGVLLQTGEAFFVPSTWIEDWGKKNAQDPTKLFTGPPEGVQASRFLMSACGNNVWASAFFNDAKAEFGDSGTSRRVSVIWRCCCPPHRNDYEHSAECG